jgi:hypothetical protein
MNRPYYSSFFLLFLLAATCRQEAPAPFSKEWILPYQADTVPSRARIGLSYIVTNNNALMFEKGDTVGLIAYDNQGRVLINSGADRPYIWKYDSTGMVNYLVERIGNKYHDYNVTYMEVPDSLLLYQQFTDIDSRSVYPETYRFDNEHRLIERAAANLENDLWNRTIQVKIRENKGLFKEDTTEKRITKRYFYDDSGNVSNIESWSDSRELKGRKSNQIFYYSGKRLDSTIRTFDHFQYTETAYFNKEGLERKRVYNDTLILNYLHVRASSSAPALAQ